MSLFKKKKSTKIKDSFDDKVLYAISDVILFFVLIIVAYPLIYVVSSSISHPDAVTGGQVLLWPVRPTLRGYKLVFSYKSVWRGFYNSFYYTILGTTLNMVFTTLCAYPLSRRNYQGLKGSMTILTISMMVGGGMIPTYIMVSGMGLTNTRAVMIILGAFGISNMLIMRTYFRSSVPQDLIDAAKVDGASDFYTLLKVVVPLSKAVFSVLTLYYAVGHWNQYFGALIYLRDQSLQPLQCVLRSMLNIGTIDMTQVKDFDSVGSSMAGANELIKYSMIVVTSVPVIAMYPFVQKYFEKGVMIGSLKG